MSEVQSVDNILYVKSINSEWKLDAEIAVRFSCICALQTFLDVIVISLRRP